MAKKASTEPMECQPSQYGDAMPMAAAPTPKPQDPRAMATALADNKADMVRRRSLQMQRQQIEISRKADRSAGIGATALPMRGHDTQLEQISVAQRIERAITS